MTDYRLYCFGESGNSFKAALMLQLCGLAWEPILVDYFNGETRGETFRSQVNPFGEAPVLVDGDLKLAQSGVILTHLSEKTDRFRATGEAERREILGWLLFDNHKFTSSIATLRFMIAILRTGENEVTQFMRGRAGSAVEIVDKRLKSRSFIIGERPTIADVSLAGYLFYPEEYGIDWAQYRGIEAWKARMAALPGFAMPYDLMPRAPALSVN